MKVRKTNKRGRVTVELGEADAALLDQGAAHDRGRFRLNTILVPVDFSSCSDKAVDYARAFADQFGAELILLHVVEPVIYPRPTRRPPTAAMNSTARCLVQPRSD